MRIGFLGDSITLGYGLDIPEKERYSHLVCTALNAEEVNLGITGTLVARAGLSRDNGTSFVERVGQLANVDFAVIFGGTNDYFWTDTPLAPSDTEADVCYFTVAVQKIIDTVLQRLPRERILLVTPYPHHGIGNYAGGVTFRDAAAHDTDTPNFVGRTLADYVDALVTIGTARGVSVLDLHRTAAPFEWRRYTLDGCHPTSDGHKWLCDAILPVIRTVLP